ncbi:MAG: hypothetical protein JF625_25730 [Inquilinus limosus]|uniref:Uncharacterized protein n=1 Tax=Inquilinus limosus TaxID=171674 RepID=A0A952FQD1_9PROT|nr:hypothetical protein [Inquilinus limosus]
MNLEEYIAHFNSLAFWKEFTFAQNKFSPRPGTELELADNLVWFGDYACVLQLKARENETEDPEAERSWFRKKVLNKATSQVRDTIRYLDENKHIRITNERGHSFDIKRAGLNEITKVVVFLGGRVLPQECYQERYHISRSVGFIHIVAADDYLGILEKLRVPEDICRYFSYREKVAPELRRAGVVVDESDIMGAFISEEDLPTPQSRESLRRFIQDLDSFDLSRLIGNLHNHIQRSSDPYDYYSIMLEFARVPRSVWRQVKIRFMKSLEAVRAKEFTRPFRLKFPGTDCAFMIAPLDPEIPAIGPEGEKARVMGLQNFTYAAMYDTKASKGVGILISRDGEFIQIDWSLMNVPLESDPEMDERLASSNLFRPAEQKMVDSFFLKSPE